MFFNELSSLLEAADPLYSVRRGQSLIHQAEAELKSEYGTMWVNPERCGGGKRFHVNEGKPYIKFIEYLHHREQASLRFFYEH